MIKSHGRSNTVRRKSGRYQTRQAQAGDLVTLEELQTHSSLSVAKLHVLWLAQKGQLALCHVWCEVEILVPPPHARLLA